MKIFFLLVSFLSFEVASAQSLNCKIEQLIWRTEKGVIMDRPVTGVLLTRDLSQGQVKVDAQLTGAISNSFQLNKVPTLPSEKLSASLIQQVYSYSVSRILKIKNDGSFTFIDTFASLNNDTFNEEKLLGICN